MVTELPKGIESGFESVGHYEESMRDFDRVLDYLDRTENISEETKEKYHHYFDEIGLDGVFELARNTNELFKELGINSYRLQLIECGRKGGRKTEELGVGIHGRTSEEKFEDRRKGGRASAKATGKHVWSLEEIVDIHNFREDSIGKGRFKALPSLDYVRDKMNEKHDEDFTTYQIKKAYHTNKHRLPDEEE